VVWPALAGLCGKYILGTVYFNAHTSSAERPCFSAYPPIKIFYQGKLRSGIRAKHFFKRRNFTFFLCSKFIRHNAMEIIQTIEKSYFHG
jgi:hypothetical protein